MNAPITDFVTTDPYFRLLWPGCPVRPDEWALNSHSANVSEHTLIGLINCPKCGIENPEGASFCMRCGKALVAEGGPGPSGGQFCYKHPKVATDLACGRCERPICTKCVVLGPAGPRCKECAKLSVAARPGAIFHTLKLGIRGLFRSGPWTVYIWILLIGMVVGGLRGCGAMFMPRGPQHQSESASDQE